MYDACPDIRFRTQASQGNGICPETWFVLPVRQRLAERSVSLLPECKTAVTGEGHDAELMDGFNCVSKQNNVACSAFSLVVAPKSITQFADHSISIIGHKDIAVERKLGVSDFLARANIQRHEGGQRAALRAAHVEQCLVVEEI